MILESWYSSDSFREIDKYKRESYIHVYYINYTVIQYKNAVICWTYWKNLQKWLMKFQYKFNEVIKNPYHYSTFDIPSILLFCFPIIPLNFIVTTNDISPMMIYILIRTLKKTDGHHVFRKAAEAVYREIIDNHWLRTMAASSKDGLSTLGKHMSPLSIQSHWLLLPHPTTTNLGEYWIHLIKY